MPLARIITLVPAESEELRRQLTAAGYSVKFTAPDEEFDDADLVVAAANVHSDYALQYASEVAAEADADVIVAPGVVAGSSAQMARPAPPAIEPAREISARNYSPEPRPQWRQEASSQDDVVPAAGVLFGTAGELKAALAEGREGIRESLGTHFARAGEAWQQWKQQRELRAEQKRLEQERRAAEREERRLELMRQRSAAEAKMVAERERLRQQREIEQQRLRREQDEMRRAMEAERARLAAEAERMRREREHAAVLAAAQQAAMAPPERVENPVVQPPFVPPPMAPVAPPPVLQQRAVVVPPPLRRPAARPGKRVSRRISPREQRFQRAAFAASIVALVAMLGFAAALNIRPQSPMPHSMVQSPVQEQSPFGAASITPAPKPVAPAPSAAKAALPQRDAAAVKPPAAKPRAARTSRHRGDNYVAEDEVVVHQYGPPKRPPAAQTRAGVRKYSDQD